MSIGRFECFTEQNRCRQTTEDGGSAGRAGGGCRYDGKKGCLIAVRDAIVDSCNEIKSNREGDGFCPGCMNFRRTTINYSKLNILRRF